MTPRVMEAEKLVGSNSRRYLKPRSCFQFIDSGLSAKILEVARLQVESDEEEGFDDAHQEEEVRLILRHIR